MSQPSTAEKPNSNRHSAKPNETSRPPHYASNLPVADAIPPRYSEKGIEQVFEVYGEKKTKQATAEGFQFFVRAWQLTDAEAAALLGVRTSEWTSGLRPNRLRREQIKRIASLIGIYRALHLYFSQPVADGWVRRENSDPLFNGQQPVQMMAHGGLPTMKCTLDYVDGLRE